MSAHLSIEKVKELLRREQAMKRSVRNFLQDVVHTDANETIFLERQLTHLRAQVYEVQFADLLARTFMPMATDIPASAETYAYKIITRVGRARISANGAGDIPRVDVYATEATGKVRSVTAGYGWDLITMREAARQNVDLDGLKARASRDTIDTSIDEMLAFGDLELSANQPNVRCEGLVNNSDSEGLGIGNPGNDPWTMDSDPQDIIADMNTQVAVIPAATKQKIRPDTLLYAPHEYEIIASKPFSEQSDMTILAWFLKNNPYIKRVEQWDRLTTAGAAGANRSICYRNDPLILQGVVPQEFEQLPPQLKGLEAFVPCHARCGGVKVYQPLGVRYTDYTPS